MFIGSALHFVEIKRQAGQECVNASTCTKTTLKTPMCYVPTCVIPTQAQARRAAVHDNL